MTDRANADWSWLQETYWYVPPRSLRALQLDPDTNTLAWAVDQTVWHITGYRAGYFWGVSATVLRQVGEETSGGSGSRPVCFRMLGSITPEGRVHLTFIPAASSSSRAATIGIGTAVAHGEGWRLEMQMSSGSGVRTAHWAYMTAVRPGDPSWDSLPGVDVSVPQMLEGCDPPRLGGNGAAPGEG
jgi:hypothetical protein